MAPSTALARSNWTLRPRRIARGIGWAVVLAWGALAPARAQYVVDDPTTFGDDDLSDGVCHVCYAFDSDGTCINQGGCTLLAAIENANVAADASTITFAVAEAELPTVVPALVTQVHIDGAVEGGRARVSGASRHAFEFNGANSGGSSVRNLEIAGEGFSFPIEFDSSPDGVVQNCRIGGTSTGAAINLVDGSDGALIGGGPGEGNVLVENGRGLAIVASGGHRVFGNLIGADEDGAAAGNTVGISIGIGGDGTLIGDGTADHRNVISASQNAGVSISGTGFGVSAPVLDVLIRGNYIGTDPAGTEALGNRQGVVVGRSEGVEVGGPLPEHGNVIAGNVDAVWLNNGATEALVGFNRIGVGAGGRVVATDGAETHGVVVRAEARDNVIRQNEIGGVGTGIRVERVNDLVPAATFIEENAIGIDPSDPADATRPILGTGIEIEGARNTFVGYNAIGHAVVGIETRDDEITILQENTIGGSDEGGQFGGDEPPLVPAGIALIGVSMENSTGSFLDGNVIDYVDDTQVLISGGSELTIQRNALGVAGALLRSCRSALYLAETEDGTEPTGVLIGGPERGNVIGACERAITLAAGQEVTISQNRSYGSMPIDLGDDGLDVNDIPDADIGPNGKQNHPYVTRAVFDGDRLTVGGILRSDPNSLYTVELFVQSELRLDSSAPWGTTFLTSVEVATDANGEGLVVIDRPPSDPERAVLERGSEIVATATDSDGNTSEMSLWTDYASKPRLLSAGLRSSDGVPGCLGLNEADCEFLIDIDLTGLDLPGTEGDLFDAEMVFEVLELIDVLELRKGTLEEPEPTTFECDGVPVSCTLGDLPAGSTERYVLTLSNAALARRASAGGEESLRVFVHGTRAGVPDTSNVLVFRGSLPVDREALPVGRSALLPPAPNPSRGPVTLRYVQATAEASELAVYDLLGRRVAAFAPTHAPDEHAVTWTTRALAAGTYVVRLTSGGVVRSRLVTVAR